MQQKRKDGRRLRTARRRPAGLISEGNGGSIARRRRPPSCEIWGTAAGGEGRRRRSGGGGGGSGGELSWNKRAASSSRGVEYYYYCWGCSHRFLLTNRVTWNAIYEQMYSTHNRIDDAIHGKKLVQFQPAVDRHHQPLIGCSPGRHHVSAPVALSWHASSCEDRRYCAHFQPRLEREDIYRGWLPRPRQY